jgi:hypothetical protein
MWPSVVVHEHWPVSQHMIVEMGDYAWSEHIVTVFLACPEREPAHIQTGAATAVQYSWCTSC